MADIFISYKREERPKALRLATALEKAGWTVWWDLELVGGEHFDDTIEAELDKARCVVVLWSKRSVKSNFVKDEATFALEEGKLLPAQIQNASVPLRFRRLHTVDLVGWRGAQGGTQFQELLNQITKRAGAPSQVSEYQRPERPSKSRPAATKKRQPSRRKYEPLSVFQDTLETGTNGPEMVVIPSGTFLMGSTEEEAGNYDHECPQHRVTFARPFAMGKYAVTYAEYDLYCEVAGWYLPDDDGWGRDNRPVVHVSWEDAVAYCEWLSAQTGAHYRLPSEAEWEYAARAGTTTAYWWGDEVGTNRANCGQCGSKWDGKQTAPVGSFGPNPFGLYDMLGNSQEWVQDCWHDNYIGAPADGSAWEAGGNPSGRVYRGGSSWDNTEDTTTTARTSNVPDDPENSDGFRLARDLD